MVLSPKEIALQYMPIFMADEKEPFPMREIGYTIFHERGKSKSCNRVIDPAKEQCELAIEYAVYFDYDIGHLYDLEHVFVYVDADGQVKDVEGSFHGKFLKCMTNHWMKLESTHPVLYLQPGKHAIMSSPELFHLFIGFRSACREEAGVDGLLLAPVLVGQVIKDDATDTMVRNYIKSQYAFVPSERYVECSMEEVMVEEFDVLACHIVNRVTEELDRIREKEVNQ